jgi:Raf kinase inhibitor-like YbhB/YbcL family protein
MSKFRWVTLQLLLAVSLVVNGCGSDATPTSPPQEVDSSAPSVEATQSSGFQLGSSSFAHGAAIPVKYSCDGEDISPPLSWSEPPAGTQSLALIFDDPDAPGGTWVHWVLYDLPPQLQTLPEAVPADAEPPTGGHHGNNSWNRSGYGGPCPPGGTHRYFFRLYALDTPLDLGPGADKDQVLEAMAGHILAQTELMGTFSR